MRSARIPVLLALALALALAGCQARPDGGTPPSLTPLPVRTEAWEPLLPHDRDAGTGDIAYDAAEPFGGNFAFGLAIVDWRGDASPMPTSLTSPTSECVARATKSPLSEAHTALDDRTASQQLLAEIATGNALEEPRRGVWLSNPSFDLTHTIVETADGVSYLAVRAFTRIGIEHTIRLECRDRASFRDAFAEFRNGGGVLASMTPAAPATAERVGFYQVRIPIDLGPTAHATGTVATDANGHPARYTVAADDEWGHIAQRFGLYAVPAADNVVADGMNVYTGYLTTINSVRRGAQPWTLYVGDTVNLSASTITSVGSTNGNVTALPAPDPLPAQR